MNNQNITSSCPKFSVQEMFNIVTRADQSFGIQNYNCVKEYLDPIKIVQDREYASSKKSSKPNPKPTKRGSFLDPINNINRKIYPAPVHYETIIQWPESKPKNPKKIKYPKRQTYVDEIFNDRYKTPGVAEYKLTASQSDIKEKQNLMAQKKIKYGEKFALWSDTEYMSIRSPGSGNYNPHRIEKKEKIQQESDTPKNQIAKDKEFLNKKKNIKMPDMGTYTPLATNYQTFDSIVIESKKQKSVKYLGSEKRFRQPSKNVFRLNVPGPGNYDVKINWKGKDGSLPPAQRKKQPKDWFDKISKGSETTRSIYY